MIKTLKENNHIGHDEYQKIIKIIDQYIHNVMYLEEGKSFKRIIPSKRRDLSKQDTYVVSIRGVLFCINYKGNVLYVEAPDKSTYSGDDVYKALVFLNRKAEDLFYWAEMSEIARRLQPLITGITDEEINEYYETLKSVISNLESIENIDYNVNNFRKIRRIIYKSEEAINGLHNYIEKRL